MTGKISEFLNGDVNSLIRIIFITLLVGLGGFLFYQATNAPTVFATKEEVKSIRIQMNDRLGRIETGVDGINKYLREKGSHN